MTTKQNGKRKEKTNNGTRGKTDIHDHCIYYQQRIRTMNLYNGHTSEKKLQNLRLLPTKPTTTIAVPY